MDQFTKRMKTGPGIKFVKIYCTKLKYIFHIIKKFIVVIKCSLLQKNTLFSETGHIYDIMRKALATYREDPVSDPDQQNLMDVLTHLDLSDETILSDMVCIMVASFHTTGLCEL